MRACQGRRSPGISLVEVLIVIAIIGVLIAMLLPAIAQSRAAARQSSCAHNIRQIGINHGSFDQVPVSHAKTVLYSICPSDPEAELRQAESDTSYVHNRAYWRYKKGMAYSKTIIFFESGVGRRDKQIDTTMWFEEKSPNMWQTIETNIALERHQEKVANYLYADGHVVAIPSSQIREWVDNQHPFLLHSQGSYFP
ncbi:MAG: type II secretion system protein [Planctomycetales bacterium]|nr:type II secretion system protein [Planctomycetales bacterium]